VVVGSVRVGRVVDCSWSCWGGFAAGFSSSVVDSARDGATFSWRVAGSRSVDEDLVHVELERSLVVLVVPRAVGGRRHVMLLALLLAAFASDLGGSSDES